MNQSNLITSRNNSTEAIVPSIQSRWCFTNRSLKIQKIYWGQRWYSTLEGYDGLMGTRNTRASQSPLHSEIWALIWVIECIRNLRQFSVTFATDFSPLVKMVLEPEE